VRSPVYGRGARRGGRPGAATLRAAGDARRRRRGACPMRKHRPAHRFWPASIPGRHTRQGFVIPGTNLERLIYAEVPSEKASKWGGSGPLEDTKCGRPPWTTATPLPSCEGKKRKPRPTAMLSGAKTLYRHRNARPPRRPARRYRHPAEPATVARGKRLDVAGERRDRCPPVWAVPGCCGPVVPVGGGRCRLSSLSSLAGSAYGRCVVYVDLEIPQQKVGT